MKGPQTNGNIEKQLNQLKKGCTVILRVPKNTYRYPPGPYEKGLLNAN